jgi:drug/metabolite transporter (DMT)-like permease
MKSQKKALFYVLLCVISWASVPVVAKSGQTNLDNHQFLFWSSLISFLVFLVIIVSTKNIKILKTYTSKDFGKIVFLGFLGTYLYYILLYLGYAKAQGIEVLALQYSWPVFIIILSRIILNEKLSGKRILSVFLGFTGVFIVISKGNISNINLKNVYVDILVITGALSFALFSVFSKKVDYESISTIFIYFLIGLFASGISMFIFSKFAFPQKSDIISILLNGIFVNGISYLFWIKALKEGEASFIAPFIFFTPVLASIFLLIFYNEAFLDVYIFGLLFVIISGLINTDLKIFKGKKSN